MPESYLDPSMSIIISAPAGSGKTEKLARRYISLLKEGSKVERILCITFTEKAAAEMKERILRILEVEDPALLDAIRPRTPMMRISTIHAFCLKVLKRFSIELGLDPSLEIMDEHRSRDLWNEALFDTLLSERSAKGIMFEIMSQRGLRGWGQLKRGLDVLSAMAPMPELLLLSGQAETSIEGDVVNGTKLLTAHAHCLARYKQLKSEHHLLDFNDLELLAARALSTVPNAQDILYSFDEHTDHVLVDEFQDTSTLQWTIIDKLTEEWRSGQGPKREKGKTPTIFLVGDEKQSIYLFRGANVAMFRQARGRLDKWLGTEYHYVEATDNYRCLPEIVDFTNMLFSAIMHPVADKDWGARYVPFEAWREGRGFVGLLNFTPGENVRQSRTMEAAALASHIRTLAGTWEIYDQDKHLRPCRYDDMAILLKKRTHLDVYESALRREGVPFIVIKGIGFFNEPEVALLMELVSFIADPSDRYPAFALLRSPMFGLDYAAIKKVSSARKPLMESLEASGSEAFKKAAITLRGFVRTAANTPLPVLLEHALTETSMWIHLADKQRLSNVKKFISIIEGYEDQGLGPVQIRERLLRQKESAKAPKANVSTEGMNAVKIMTIHAAKGLQFPIVLLPGMEEALGSDSQPIVFDDTGGTPLMGFEEDNAKRKKIDIFIRDKDKHEEEEKRLFYVAITRARDYLLMSGARGKKITGRLQYLDEAFGLYSKSTAPHSLPFAILDINDIAQSADAAPGSHVDPPHGHATRPRPGAIDIPVNIAPLEHTPSKRWEDVTDNEDDKRPGRGHGEGRTIIGTTIHKVLENISKGLWDSESMLDGASKTLMREGGWPELQVTLADELRALHNSPLWDEIIAPREGSYSELPFILDKGAIAYTGRIDRVIIEADKALIYDYKTFPFKENEIPEIKEKYQHQMRLYHEAVEKLLAMPVRAFLVLTFSQKVVEIS